MWKIVLNLKKDRFISFLFLTPDKKNPFETNAFKVLSVKILYKFRLTFNLRSQLHTKYFLLLPTLHFKPFFPANLASFEFQSRIHP